MKQIEVRYKSNLKFDCSHYELEKIWNSLKEHLTQNDGKNINEELNFDKDCLHYKIDGINVYIHGKHLLPDTYMYMDIELESNTNPVGELEKEIIKFGKEYRRLKSENGTIN